MKTLAVCIPTYKRPAMLEQCVRSAIAAADGCPITICIADDSMCDVNDAVLGRLSREFSCLVVDKNLVNLGIDDNIQNVLRSSRCDYSWLIGEDDLFLPGAIKAMHELIQSVDVPFIFSNYKYVSEDHGRDLGTPGRGVTAGSQHATVFIENYLWSIGFIGACVIRMDAWRNTDPQPYKASSFTHVGRILELLAREPLLYCSDRVAVANRAQGKDTFTWKKDSFGVFLGFERMCEVAATRNPLLANALQEAVSDYRNRFAYFAPKTALRLRAEGAYDYRQYCAYIRSKKLPYAKKLWFFILALVPVAALKPVTFLYRVLHARRHQFGAQR
jgi:glycosyltransferase involved in cell wall biosynthesis